MGFASWPLQKLPTPAAHPGKGLSTLYVEGRPRTREYEAKEGSGKRYRTEMVARQIGFWVGAAMGQARRMLAKSILTGA